MTGVAEAVAVAGETGAVIRVERAYFHPRLRREFDPGLHARSMDPRDGPPAYPAYDIAVLQLAQEGGELPPEVKLLGDADLAGIDGRAVALLGYSGEIEAGVPAPPLSGGRKLEFRAGILEASVSYGDKSPEFSVVAASDPPTMRRWLRSTANLGSGASGSPLYLEDGSVIGVASGRSGVRLAEAPHSFNESIRVDVLREILDFHGLGVDAADRDPGRRISADLRPDPRLPSLRRAVALERQAEMALDLGDYRAAGEHCNEALALAPDYGLALLRRSEVYLRYCENQWWSLTTEQRMQFLDLVARVTAFGPRIKSSIRSRNGKSTWPRWRFIDLTSRPTRRSAGRP